MPLYIKASRSSIIELIYHCLKQFDPFPLLLYEFLDSVFFDEIQIR